MRYLAAFCVVLLALSHAQPVCACSTKQMGYRGALKSDLRNLVTSEEDYRAKAGAYASDLALISNETGFALSPGVTLTVERVDDRGWTARARHARWKGECVLTAGPDAPPGQEGIPLCQGSVYDSTSSAIQASVMLLVVVAALVFASVSGLRGRAPWWPMIPLGLLLVFHPSWSLLGSASRGEIPGQGDCGGQLQMTALLFAIVAGMLWWWQRKRIRVNVPSLTGRSL